MAKNGIRLMAIDILDEPNGISLKSYKFMCAVLTDANSTDVINEITEYEGRYFLEEHIVDELRKSV
jgi:hypothetical protein